MSDLVAKRQLNRGYNDGFARAVEIVVTPLLFGFLGGLADRALGTRPLLTIGFAAFAVVGIVVKQWLGYDRQMRDHESGAVWSRPRVATVASLAAGAPAATIGTLADEAPAADGATADADRTADAVDATADVDAAGTTADATRTTDVVADGDAPPGGGGS